MSHAFLQPEAELFRALRARLQLSRQPRRFPERVALAAFMFVTGAIAIALLSLLAMLTRSPFVFPSLGPTAFLLFFKPRSVSASPRHALLGHLTGLACGYAALLLTGLTHAPAALQMGVDPARIVAAAFSLAATGAAMILLKVVHPPAGATTLIVSLGIIAQPRALAVIELAVLLLVVCAFVLNRFAGIDYPLWEARRSPS